MDADVPVDRPDPIATEMINNYRGISNLQLAPNGVVTQIYPLGGNEAAIGHDLLNDPRRRIEAQAAIESRKLTLAGPFTLVQRGMGVIGRLPVFVPVPVEVPNGRWILAIAPLGRRPPIPKRFGTFRHAITRSNRRTELFKESALSSRISPSVRKLRRTFGRHITSWKDVLRNEPRSLQKLT